MEQVDGSAMKPTAWAGGPGYDLLQPDPAGTVRSLTSMGYSPAAAVADIVDNSVAAGASTVELAFHWSGADSWIAIADDGGGMDQAALLAGMTVGARGGATDRGPRDLGRFGMGLKTASFSQARELVVTSRPAGGEWTVRSWDVDRVIQVGEWRLLHGASPQAESSLERLTRGRTQGTVVLWRRLTRLVPAGATAGDDGAQRLFHAAVRDIEHHLSMVFGKLMTSRTRRLRVRVNDRALEPWDPFMSGHPQLEVLPTEVPAAGVLITGHVLPHRSRLSPAEFEAGGGPAGWLAQQGFYLYRRDRLIVAGGWLGLKLRREQSTNLARISVTLPTSDDTAWALDVRKATATPPAHLTPVLARVARATRARAEAVVNHKGRVVRDRQSVAEDQMWQLLRQHGQGRFRINRKHPVVLDLLERSPATRIQVSTLLGLVEEALPIGAIRAVPEDDVPATTETEVPSEVLTLARHILDVYLSDGLAPSAALTRIASMPPFDRYPSLPDALTGGRPPVEVNP